MAASVPESHLNLEETPEETQLDGNQQLAPADVQDQDAAAAKEDFPETLQNATEGPKEPTQAEKKPKGVSAKEKQKQTLAKAKAKSKAKAQAKAKAVLKDSFQKGGKQGKAAENKKGKGKGGKKTQAADAETEPEEKKTQPPSAENAAPDKKAASKTAKPSGDKKQSGSMQSKKAKAGEHPLPHRLR